MNIADIDNKTDGSSTNGVKINRDEKNKSVKKKNWSSMAKSKILVKSKNHDFFLSPKTKRSSNWVFL